MNKDWNSINYISVIIVSLLSVLGGILNTKKHCVINDEKCKSYGFLKLSVVVISHIIFDAISIGSISLIVYLGLVGYGINDLLSVAIAGFLASEGNKAIYQFKLVLAEKLNSQALMEELKKDKEHK